MSAYTNDSDYNNGLGVSSLYFIDNTSSYLTTDGIQTITNKTIDFSLNTILNAGSNGEGFSNGYAIAPSTHDSNLIPKWGASNSKTLVAGIVAPNGTLVGTNDTQILTNKTIDYNLNTINNIPEFDASTINTSINNIDIRTSNLEILTNTFDPRLDILEATDISLDTRIISLSNNTVNNTNNLNTLSNQLQSNITNDLTKVVAPITNTINYIPQWSGTNNKTLVNGIDIATLTTLTSNQTLTNKTIIGTTNNIAAKSLLSATTTIDLYSALAPSTGQVLTAINSTSAQWSTPSSGGGSGSSSNLYQFEPTVNISNVYNPYIFKAYSSTSQGSLTSNTWTKKTFELIEYDINNNFDIINSKYTIPISGYYILNARILFTNTTQTIQQYGVRIKKNGSIILCTNINISASTLPTLTIPEVSDIKLLTIGDYLEVEGYTSIGTSSAMTASAVSTIFSGYLIAPSSTIVNIIISNATTLSVLNNYSNTIFRGYLTTSTALLAATDTTLFTSSNLTTEYSSSFVSYLSTGIFKINYPGIYEIIFNITANSSSTITDVRNYIYLNSVSVNTSSKYNNTTQSISDKGIYYASLSLNDKISFVNNSAGTGTVTLQNGTDLTYIIIRYVSPIAGGPVNRTIPYLNTYQDAMTSGSAQGFSANAIYQTIRLDTVISNLTTYNNTSSVFTIPLSGYYHIYSQVTLSFNVATSVGYSTGDYYMMRIYKNNTTSISETSSISITIFSTININDILYFTAGDTFRIQINVNTHVSTSVSTGFNKLYCKYVANPSQTSTTVYPISIM